MIPTSSETLTIGVILLFLFGAISFYLYSRITQIEKKMSLLENILLDLKVATESSITSFPLPDQSTQPIQHIPNFNYMFANTISENIQEPIDIDNSEEVLEELEEVPESSINTEPLIQEQPIVNNTIIQSIPDEKEVNIIQPTSSYVESVISVNKSSESPYENMTVKELQVIAKTKGISVSGLKRVQIIDILKQYDLNKTEQSDKTDVMPVINEVPTIEEIFSSGEGGELLSMDAPSSLIEASSIDN
jgi:hypothetical protein